MNFKAKKVQNHEFQSQKKKKKTKTKTNTTCLNGESKSHNIWKTNFTENLAKTLIKYDKKSWLFIGNVGSYWILDHLVGHIFPIEMIVCRPKLVLKWMRYHKNTKTLIMSSLYFLGKLAVFYPASHNKLYRLARTGMNGLDHLEEQGLS